MPFNTKIGLLLILVFIIVLLIQQYRLNGKGAKERPVKEDPNGLTGYLFLGGRRRSYYLHLPDKITPNQTPLIIAFHGGYGNAFRFSQVTGFNKIADREGVAVVYPNACIRWNDGRGIGGFRSDDLMFVQLLIDHLVRSRHLDGRRIYAAGLSSGGMFVFRLACQMADKIAAFATVSATMPASLRTRIKSTRPVPMLMINGTADRLVPWQGGQVGPRRFWSADARVLSVPDTIAYWQECNGCLSSAQIEPISPDGSDQDQSVEIINYKCRAPGSTLVLIKINGGRHHWPGSAIALRRAQIRFTGRIIDTLDASESIWRFFREHELPKSH